MQKIVFLLIVLITLTSCGNDVQFNSPALQANKNYELWRASYYDAVLADSGKLTISAGNNKEKMTFVLSTLQQGTYSLSDMSLSKIDFVDFENVSYSTSNTPNPESYAYPEIGKITITKIDGNTITGTFRFIAFTADGMNSVGFNEGIFHELPVR